MICNECKSRNPVGNRFCRECGAKLGPLEGELAAEEAARVERERLNERVAGLLSAAFTLSEQKRYEQALPLAREAALLLPDSTAAHSLLASLYERTDREREAIAEMERVVALNPESAADIEKLAQLRRGIHVLPRDPAESISARQTPAAALSARITPNWLPAVMAGGTVALILGVGVSILNRHGDTDGRRTYSATARPTAAQPGDTAILTGQQQPAAGPEKGILPPAGEVRPDPFASLGIARMAGGQSLPGSKLNNQDRPTESGVSRAGTLPLPFRDMPRTSSDTPLTASDRTLPPIIAAPPSLEGGQDVTGFGAGQRITVGPPGATLQQGSSNADSGGGAPVPQRSAPENGYIRITVGNRPAATAIDGGRETPASSTSTENPLARARHLQSAGRFSDAIAAYQEALGSGTGQAGDVHQGIAQCYHRLNDDGNARSEYQSAISAYESQASSGHGAASAQRGAAACKAALEALGG